MVYKWEEIKCLNTPKTRIDPLLKAKQQTVKGFWGNAEKRLYGIILPNRDISDFWSIEKGESWFERLKNTDSYLISKLWAKRFS